MIFKKIVSLTTAVVLSISVFLLSAAAEAPTSGVITGNGVRLRSGPGTEYSILDHFYKGDVLTVVTPGEDWVKVKYDDETGYVSKDYFTYLTKSAKTLVAVNDSDVVSYAKSFLGVPYVWGGSSPSGFDCSGFTQYVFEHFGIDIPRTASQQYKSTAEKRISKSELKPGDLVFFNSPSTSSVAHVGIYIGGGKFIHSNSPGGSVRITSLSSSYYTAHYIGASSMN